MIRLSEKARMECDHEGCKTSLRVSLALLPSGGFGIDVPLHAVDKWQLTYDSNNPLKPYASRCPEHRVSSAPQIHRLSH
jgi:hypothetical protein